MSTHDKQSVSSPPSLSRRRFIATVGGGVILAAGAGLAGFSLTRTPRTALAPWAEAGQYSEPRRFALSFAILAPNPHNLQPWMIDLTEPNMVTLLADPDRRLPETDPFDRQLAIGLGGFLELMRIAASTQGYEIDVSLFPDGSDPNLISARPVAKIHFRHSLTPPDPLFNFISSRRSTKEPFDMEKTVHDSNIAALATTVPGVGFAGTCYSGEVAVLRQLIWDAFKIEYETPATLQESIDLMRFGKAAINASPDGIDIGGMPLEGLQRLGLISPRDLATPGTLAYQTGLDMYENMFAATPAFVWLTTTDNSRESQIAAGKAWLQLNLMTTQSGLALHPVSQCLQEYPQMRNHYQHAHQLLAGAGETVQMLGRLGYAAAVPPTPRWSLDEKIRFT